MSDSSEWELSKENVQPLREGRKIAALTCALQHHTPTDVQHIKDQRNFFEQQIRMYDGDDSLEVWDSYIKWTEQNFPRGGKDGNLLELLQRCLTHFQNHEGYKNDPRFVHIWIKFANFSDDPVEIYRYMFDQNIGCHLAVLYEEWANFVERLGNTKKADSIYLDGISRGAQPLDVLKLKHSEFQMRVARGLVLQPREEADERQTGEEQRMVLGRLRADKKNRVGSTRTGTAKLGQPRALASSVVTAPQQQRGTGFQVFQDENAPVSSVLQQTGEHKTIPVREQFNRENEQVPGVWTKAKAPQRKGVAAAAATPATPAFQIHEDESTKQDQHANAALVDSHILSSRKADKPGHLLDPIRKVASRDERPMYCKEKVYCGTQEFSLEELRSLKYIEKKKKKQQEEEQRKLAEQLNEMRLIRDQVQKDIETMRTEHKQLIEKQRQLQLSTENSGVQPSPMPIAGGGQFCSAQNTPSFGAPLSSAPSSGSFNAARSSAPSSASFSAPQPSGRLSTSFSSVPTSASSSANSSLQRRGPPASAVSGSGLQNASLNSSQRTPVFSSEPSVSSGSGSQHHPHQPLSAGPTPDSNTSKHSLTSASPTMNMKEALQMVQGMYNATLDCDKISAWNQEDTEMTEAVQPAPPPTNAAPIMVFDETEQKAVPAGTAPKIFCDENAPLQENRPPRGNSQKGRGRVLCEGRRALQERPGLSAPAPVQEFMAEDDGMGEGTEFYPQYDVTLAAVGSQDSFAAAARAASTPFGFGRHDDGRLPSISLSSIKPHKIARENSDEEMVDSAAVQTNDSEAQHSQNAQFHTFNQTRLTPVKNDLSPIIEGSSEGSSQESRSHAASTLGASSRLRHPSGVTSTCDVDPAPMDSSSDKHVIDTSHYVPAEVDEKTEALLSMSVCIDPHNPFDEATIKNFLKRISPPLDQREGYVECNQRVPNFTGCQFINLGMETYQLQGLIGEGGYAKVYHAECFTTSLDDSMDTMDIEPSNLNSCVIKVQKPSAPWEYYICSEIHQRLQKCGLAYMRPCMMEITQAYFYQDGSCLVSDFCPLGSLLGQVNQLKKQRELMGSLEPLAAFLTIHLLRMVEALHRCHIIHGDIKPDNILLTGFSMLPPGSSKEDYFGTSNQCLRLVDFGQAIDMSLYPPSTTFLAKVGTSGFQCIEMMTDQPWTYQTDMFGLAGSVHVLVFGQYMKVYNSQDQWHMTSSFQRKWKVDLWKKLFHQLLNIADCSEQPDLASLRREFEDHFMTNLAPHFNSILTKVQGVTTTH
ncbi:mitotic checkpoint serine/threonine-protein kinase BUB1-like [Babylonia areolata]|uniref:mitotic checkpoint serine/threonine-protein kinase BUB1-like n=1 Tax=Babylonia areolata TaxID=304850 RepID=UPI003FD16014